MRKSVSTKDLLKALQKVGFAQTRLSKGSHVLLRHQDSGLVVTVPTSRSDVPPVIFFAIERQMENFGVITKEKFENMLQGI